MKHNPIDNLTKIIGRLPGLGPRSARRLVLTLLNKKETLMSPLIQALQEAEINVVHCSECGHIDIQNPCHICTDPQREKTKICVVENVADLWALERTSAFNGIYHILGGTLSAIDGRGPEELNIPKLIHRIDTLSVQEVILALNATLEGQTTIHYITECLSSKSIKITGLAHGVPIGGELDYLDDGTIVTAFKARAAI